MVKAEELMIGNWVIAHDNKPHKITASCIVAQSQFDIANAIGYMPISLSEGILLKCGLVENGDTRQFHLEEQIVSFSKLDGAHFWIMDTDKCIRCKYLHQLQNVWFIHKGKQLTINLNK